MPALPVSIDEISSVPDLLRWTDFAWNSGFGRHELVPQLCFFIKEEWVLQS